MESQLKGDERVIAIVFLIPFADQRRGLAEIVDGTVSTVRNPVSMDDCTMESGVRYMSKFAVMPLVKYSR